MTVALKRSVAWMMAGLVAIATAAAVRALSLGTLRVDEVETAGLARATVALLTALGLGALGAGFLAGLAALSNEQVPRPSWRTLTAIAAALQCIAALALPLTSNDIFSNLLYGHLEAFGGIFAATATPAALRADPLHVWVGDAWNATPCVYGPVLIAFHRWISIVSGGTLLGGVIVTKLAMLCVSLVWVVLCAKWVERFEPEALRRPLFWLLVCNPVWLSEVAGQAHNDGIPVLFVLLAILGYRRGWAGAAAALLAVAACAKYFAVVPFACLLLWTLLRGPGSLWRRFRAVGSSTLIFAGVVAVCYAPSWEGWSTLSYPWSFISAPRFVGSLLHVAYACGYPRGADAMLAAARGAGLALAVLLAALTIRWVHGWWTSPSGIWAPWELSFRFVLLYLLLLTGFFMPWYLTWLLPLVAVVRDRRWWTVVAVYSCSAALYFGMDFLLDLVLPGLVSRVMRPVINQGPVVMVLLRMAAGLPPLPWRSRMGQP